MRSNVRVFQVLVLVVVAVFLMSCAGKKHKRDEDAALSSETVSSDYVTEEAVRGPADLEEEELEAQARRALKAQAEQEGALEDVNFEFNAYTLSAQVQQKLQRTAQWLEDNATVSVQIEGHCDDRGSTEYNLALGERRSVAVENYLVSLGIGSDRMDTISYGEERSVDQGNNEKAWAKNRRAHFEITGR